MLLSQGQGGRCWLLLNGQLCSVVSSCHLQNKHHLSVSSCRGQLQRAQPAGWGVDEEHYRLVDSLL